MKVIDVKDLVKYYGKNKALDSISLNVNQGDFYGFVGPNGAGKSTLIKVLLNFIFKKSGQADVFGMDSQKNSVDIKRITSYVPSDVRYYPNYNCYDLCKLTLELNGLKDDGYLEHIIKELNIDPKKKFSELSLGNRKKVGIAVALIKKPKLYIMDEPTNGLDPLVKKSLFSLLKAEVENGSTVFISSHNLKEIEDHCNRVAFIKLGKIIDEVEIDDNMNRSKVVKIVGKFDDAINSLEGLRDLKVNESYYRFLFNGEMSTLLSKLNNMEISDISINNISLEEEFLGYYESGENHDN